MILKVNFLSNPLPHIFAKEEGCLLSINFLSRCTSYLPNNSSSLWHSSTVAWQNNKLSSANKRCEIRTPCLLDKTPLRDRFSLALLSKVESPSAHNRSKYGESGSPYFIPIEGEKKLLGSPLIIIE